MAQEQQPLLFGENTSPVEMLPIEAWAKEVQAAANAVPASGRFGDERVFIASAWEAVKHRPEVSGGSLAAFKSRLPEANRLGLLSLTRADLVGAMDPALVRASETKHLNAEFHFIVVAPAPAPAQHPTASAKTSKATPGKARRPSRQFRVLGYDGNWRVRDRTPAGSDGHRIQITVVDKDAALLEAEKWKASYPPVGDQARLTVEEVITRTGDVSTVARWVPTKDKPAQWQRQGVEPPKVTVAKVLPKARRARKGHEAPCCAAPSNGRLPGQPIPITSVGEDDVPRRPCGLGEVDRVLGGGLVPGSLILISGPPGAGKSSLLLQLAYAVACTQGPSLYVTGEETESQVAQRASRLGTRDKRLHLLAESSSDAVVKAVREMKPQPALLIVDSVQKMRRPKLRGRAGGSTQVKAVAVQLQELARTTGIPIIIVSHVNKTDRVAGPKALEHEVDATLSLELDADGTRVLRSDKNRNGSTLEVGRFRMTAQGLEPRLPPGAKAPASGQHEREDGTEVTAIKGKPLPPTPRAGDGYELVDKTKHASRRGVRPVRRVERLTAKALERLTPRERRVARQVEQLQCSAAAASKQANAIEIEPYERHVAMQAERLKTARAVLKEREAANKLAEREASRGTSADRKAARSTLRDARCALRLARGESRQAERNLEVAKTELRRAWERKIKRQSVAASREQAADRAARGLPS